jgi:hypothetical protein
VQSAIDLPGSYTSVSPNIVLTGNGDVTACYLNAGAATNFPLGPSGFVWCLN